MTTALVVNDVAHSNNNLMESLHNQYKSWEMVGVDKYEDALEKIQTGIFDVMTLDSHIPSKDCQKLVDSLHTIQPDAKVYIAMNDDNYSKTDYSRVMDRGLILIPTC
jgi:DNA-binding NtrC family response regulator